jgi:hypothetical protein
MANAFKNSITGIIGTESRRVYKAPGSTTSTVIGLSLANISAAEVNANVLLIANTSFQAHLIRNAPIPVGSSLVVIGGDQKVVLEAADEMRVKSSASASLSAVVSVLEQS